jgi:hypothetical protein
MSETQMLIGSLSNDLFRVANLTQRGSIQGAMRFFEEAKRWCAQLDVDDKQIKPYIRKIVGEIHLASAQDVTLEKAEKYLMYGILLQNYSLHNQ